MVIVTGTVVGRPDTIDELARLGVEHCVRSRAEPGCLTHNVHRDVEDDLRLVFVERWEDRAALDAHFAVPESGAYVTRAMELAAEPPRIQIYEIVPR